MVLTQWGVNKQRELNKIKVENYYLELYFVKIFLLLILTSTQ